MQLEVFLAAATFAFLALMGLAFYLSPLWNKKPGPDEKEDDAGSPREGAASQPARSQRARLRANAARQRFENLMVEEATTRNRQEASPPRQQAQDKGAKVFDVKVGAKKQAKLEEKARRKAAREEEEQLREERKAAELLKEEERKKESEKEKQEQLLREEQERKEIEERERREHEEYLQMKAAFSVEGEGFEEEGDDDTEKNLLKEFIDHIKMNKVVILEDLAAHFKLKTQAAIDRITTLQNEGVLTGVIDDRGKFIYITQQELENVAKFVRQRGRVSIVDLVEKSNELINLTPTNKVS